MNEFQLAAIPGPLRWINDPLSWQLMPDSKLAIKAGPGTDWFADPGLGSTQDDAPAALFATTGEEFVLSARVTVSFAATFGAGVLQLRSSASH